jgi:E1-E2 ATPase
VNFEVTSIDTNQLPLPQITQWLLALIEAPYSALVSNVLLVILACVFVTAGILVSWIATHPEQIRHVIMGWRRRSRVRQAERYLQQGLAFLLRRFDLVGAYGLSFTIALAALLLGVWFFGSVLEDLLAYNDTALLDAPVASFMALHRIAWLTTVMKAINLLGSGGSVIIIALGTAVLLRYQAHGWRLPLFLLAVVAGAEILDLATGFLVARPRPPAAWMAVSASTYGFTPGQTTVSVLYGVVAYLIAQSGAWRSKVFIWSGTILIVFLIGVSRVYLGTDWLTDVLSRWALALIWLAAALIVVDIVEQTSRAAIALPAATSPEVAPEAPLEPLSIPDVRRAEVSINGLSQSEVAERHGRGEVNIVNERSSRTVGDILRANIFTRFNALLGALFAVVLLLGGKQDALFGLVLIPNTAVGIVQELRAKRTLDRLRVLVAPRAHVVRDGTLQDVPADQIVIDDVLELHPGDQVPIDGRLLAAQSLEVNESLLTGEADPISKSRGDQVLSGSFIVAGGGRLQAVQIGEASYARRLARAAQQFTLSRSQLRSGVNDILRYVTWALIPTALLLSVTQLLYSPAGVHDAAVSSIAGVVGMVPEGLVLLMSTVMAIAVVRLAAYGALVQELAAVELGASRCALCGQDGHAHRRRNHARKSRSGKCPGHSLTSIASR